jgi:hypothetical protein
MPTPTIIQASFPRAASTLLVNALYGLIVGMQDRPVIFNDFIHMPMPHAREPVTIYKTHETNLADLADPNTYFICSERSGHNRFAEQFRHDPYISILDYADVTRPPASLCSHLAAIVAAMLPDQLLSVGNCIARIHEMNQRYEQIKYLPFDYVDPFYQLHGSHRLRGKEN